MISDKTIEEKTAKYWCAFADKDFKKALDTILSTIANGKTQEIALKLTCNNAIASRKSLNEGVMDFFAKYAPTDPTGGSVGIVGDNWGRSPEEAKANAEAMATAAGVAATVLTPIGRTAAKAVGKGAVKHPVATGITATAGKLAMDAVGDEGDSWMTKLEKLVNKIWDIGKFTTDHAKEIAVASTVAYALFKTAGIWMPMLASSVKALLRGNSLATVDFDSNGTWYRMRYDIKYKRWQLLYKGISLGATPPPEETEQLMSTEFFKAFLDQCEKYILPIVDNSMRSAVIDAIASISDKKTKQALEVVFSDKTTIDNMLAMKFKY